MSTKAKKASTKKAAPAVKAAKAEKPVKVVLKAGASADGRRGLMGKMMEAVAKTKGGLSRDELASRFAKEPRVKVSKNVNWGLRHGVFKEARA
jgi:hypothetical protein